MDKLETRLDARRIIRKARARVNAYLKSKNVQSDPYCNWLFMQIRLAILHMKLTDLETVQEYVDEVNKELDKAYEEEGKVEVTAP